MSTRKVELITEELFRKKFSKSTVSILCKKLGIIVEAFRTRPLGITILFFIVDTIHVKVLEYGRIESCVLLISVGIN